MATDFTIKRDDRLPEIQAQLEDADEENPNLAGSSVRFIMTNKLTAEVKVDEEATIVDEDESIVKYSWAEGDTDTAGNYNGEFEVEFPDGRLATFPNSRHIQIKVFEDLGGVL